MIIYNDNDNLVIIVIIMIFTVYVAPVKEKERRFMGAIKNSKKLRKILRLKFQKCLTIYKHAFS